MSHGSSQARGQIRAAAAALHHSPLQHQIQAVSVTYAAACGNAGSLAYRARPGIKPAFSWILVGFVTTEPQWELHPLLICSDFPFLHDSGLVGYVFLGMYPFLTGCPVCWQIIAHIVS